MKKNKSVPTRVLVIYIILFFIWWSVFELSHIQFFKVTLLQEVMSSAIKLITWVLPVICLLNKYSDSVEIPLSKMFVNKFKIFPYLILGICMVGYILLGDIIVNGSLKVTETIQWTDLIGFFLVVGITEELVFRGWILNALVRKTSTRKAIFISSLLFFFIHFPIWIQKGILLSTFTSGDFISIFILSVIFSISFLKSRNIMVPIIIHMLWDGTIILIFS